MEQKLHYLFKACEKKYYDKMKDLLEKNFVNLTELTVLQRINDGFNTSSKIAKEEHMLKSAISMCVSKLLIRNFIKATRNENNKREIVLELTNYGKDLVLESLERKNEFYQLILNGIDLNELNELRRLASIIIKNVNSLKEE